ncbi:MAG: prepilin-type N-terminal cleavage/methylation domain-containing protein [Desulfobacterales bacterium]|nr:prepilin-type N-terminal cleavage/methylation domain-containing protein [Deltaproteobacteria bacterium]NNL43404.1 prepilin-type N-terminal cleavage/methylation domain-containing protein [Desulfobacterales bacterium]
MKDHDGFTLIELMVVISIIGILAGIAIPNFIKYRDKAFLCEGLELSGPVRKDIIEYYDHRGVFPASNAELGFPEAIKGKHVESIKVNNGAIKITYNDSARTFSGEVITLRPVINDQYPTGPLTWEREDSYWKKKKAMKRKGKKRVKQ